MPERDGDAIVDYVTELAGEFDLYTDSLIVDLNKAISLSLWRKESARPDSQMILMAVLNWCKKSPNTLIIKPSRSNATFQLDLANPNCTPILTSYLKSFSEGAPGACRRTPSKPWCDHEECQ